MLSGVLRLRTSAERPALQAPDAGSFGAERDGLEHVRAPTNPAVDDHLGAAPDRLDDLGKCVERPRCVIELPAAVVRHVDGVYSGFDGEGRILAGGDALQDDW